MRVLGLIPTCSSVNLPSTLPGSANEPNQRSAVTRAGSSTPTLPPLYACPIPPLHESRLVNFDPPPWPEWCPWVALGAPSHGPGTSRSTSDNRGHSRSPRPIYNSHLTWREPPNGVTILPHLQQPQSNCTVHPAMTELIILYDSI